MNWSPPPASDDSAHSLDDYLLDPAEKERATAQTQNMVSVWVKAFQQIKHRIQHTSSHSLHWIQTQGTPWLRHQWQQTHALVAQGQWKETLQTGLYGLWNQLGTQGHQLTQHATATTRTLIRSQGWAPQWSMDQGIEQLTHQAIHCILVALWWHGLGLTGLGWWWVTLQLGKGLLAIQSPWLHQPAQQYMQPLQGDERYTYRGALMQLLGEWSIKALLVLVLGLLLWVGFQPNTLQNLTLFGHALLRTGLWALPLGLSIVLMPCVRLTTQLAGSGALQNKLTLTAQLTEISILLLLNLMMGGLNLILVAWVHVMILVLALLVGLALMGVVHMDPDRLEIIREQHQQFARGQRSPVLNHWLYQGGFIVVAGVWIGPSTAGVLGLLQQLAQGVIAWAQTLYPWPKEILHACFGENNPGWSVQHNPLLRYAVALGVMAILMLLPLYGMAFWALLHACTLAQTIWLWLIGLHLGSLGLRLLHLAGWYTNRG
ncbi:MAG: hypothetical protein U0003_01730 [Vampirovibrionales bacterium]